jgi:hypothetical protein
MRLCMLLRILEVAKDELCLLVLEVLDVIRCVLLCRLEAVEGGLCLLEVMRCMLLCVLKL